MSVSLGGDHEEDTGRQKQLQGKAHTVDPVTVDRTPDMIVSLGGDHKDDTSRRQQGSEKRVIAELKTGEVSFDINKIAESLRESTERLEPLSGDCCIYIVPPLLREQNKEIFTPRVVSIGPFHHGKKELRSMEEHKRRYLCKFLERIGTSMEDYIEGLKELETRLRQSYVDINGYDREEFMEMMAVDGGFLMEYFLRNASVHRKKNDRIFGRQYLNINVMYDLLLIENQIPFFLLKHLFRLFKKSRNIDQSVTLMIMVQHYLCSVTPWEWSTTVDVITEDTQVLHLLHFLILCLQQSDRKERRECDAMAIPTISELHQAGVKFKPIPSNCLFNINFTNGILRIPILRLTDQVEIPFRNMQAFEQCHGLDYYYVSDYIYIMDRLINNEEDVKVLVENRIIDNWLQDNRAAAAVFNNLGNGNLTDTSNFSYTQLIEDLNSYYNTTWHKWKATFKQKYCNNPWTAISVVAASVLLLLTIIQTVCSILQVD